MTDWPTVLAQLRAAGLTRAHIAGATGKHVNTIELYERGDIKEPPHSVGEMILSLHQLYCASAQPCTNSQDPGGGVE